MSHWPNHCERCGADLAKVSSIMSKFNQDTICSPCKARERAHPGYNAADVPEVAAVRAADRLREVRADREIGSLLVGRDDPVFRRRDRRAGVEPQRALQMLARPEPQTNG